MRQPSPAALQRQCDDWNARYPVGQRVTVRNDDGGHVTSSTRSEAQVLSGHSAVIWLEGITGCYLLDRVRPITGGEGRKTLHLKCDMRSMLRQAIRQLPEGAPRAGLQQLFEHVEQVRAGKASIYEFADFYMLIRED